MLHNVYLYGELGEKYGKDHRFDISNAPEAIRALTANFKGFLADFMQNKMYEVIVGDKENGLRITEDRVNFNLGRSKELHIIPVAAGSKTNVVSGAIMYVAATVLVVAGAFFHQPWMIGMGISLAFSGLATMLTPMPKVGTYDTRESPDARSSFIFNGAVNKNTEGAVIPLVYGRMRVGSVVVSAGIEVAQV